jgi:hypothetical protein
MHSRFTNIAPWVGAGDFTPIGRACALWGAINVMAPNVVAQSTTRAKFHIIFSLTGFLAFPSRDGRSAQFTPARGRSPSNIAHGGLKRLARQPSLHHVHCMLEAFAHAIERDRQR